MPGAVGSCFETIKGNSIGMQLGLYWKTAWVEGLNQSPLSSSLPLDFLL